MQSAAAVAAMFAVTPTKFASASTKRASTKSESANDRLNVGIIGFGVRGRELHGGFLDDPTVEIVSVADVCSARADEGVRMVNDRRKATVCRRAENWRAMIADPSIDAVLIATPDHWHAEPAIAACLAGRHVYCEKPMSLTIAEGRTMADAARTAGIRFQTGSQQRSEFSHYFVSAAEAVRNGRIGTLKRITIGVGVDRHLCADSMRLFVLSACIITIQIGGRIASTEMDISLIWERIISTSHSGR